MVVQPMISVTRILTITLFCGACFALPTSVEASILSGATELAQGAAARPGIHSPFKILADTSPDPNLSAQICQSLFQSNDVASAGYSSTSGSGPLAGSTAVTSVAPRSSPQLVFRLCEASLVIPSPHLERILRP